VIDCNEWKTEKHHDCTNMGEVKQLELWCQLYVTLLPEQDVRNIRPLDFCWTVYNHTINRSNRIHCQCHKPVRLCKLKKYQ